MIDHDAFVGELQAALDAAANESTRAWWVRYLRGEASFRGVKMAEVRAIVDRLVERHGVDAAPVDQQLALAHACMACRDTEDKLAGVLLLAEHTMPALTVDHVADLARPLADRHLADWNIVDWYCVKVLGPYIESGNGADDIQARAEAVAAWRSAGELWQRRAAAVAFVNLVGRDPELFAGLTDLVLDVCDANAADPTRWSQTSVGWVLRELSRRDPESVRHFLEEHPELSHEAGKNASKHL